MVCSLGSGRMAAMARLLTAGAASQTVAEVGHQKLAAQYIHRELREADEANLLDEEDMHVFGLKPMSDPLHLVCCNACKKPVKESHYAAHAELCKSLGSAQEIVSGRDGCSRNRKPPKKEKKKLLTAYANRATSVGKQERFESLDADGSAITESDLDKQFRRTSSFSMGSKSLATNGSGINFGNADYTACGMPPPMKRPKVIGAEGLPLSHHFETATDVSKSLCINTQEALICSFPRGSSSGSRNTGDHTGGSQMPRQAHEGFLLKKDVAAPLATKVFYSQKRHRLRSELTRHYYEASSKDQSSDSVSTFSKDYCNDLVIPKLSQGNTMPLQASSPKPFFNEQLEDPLEKMDRNSLHSVQKPDQVPGQNSEIQLIKSGGCPAAIDLVNQTHVNSALGLHGAPVGLMRSNFLPKPYSFAGNSGRPIGTMRQADGIVPVT